MPESYFFMEIYAYLSYTSVVRFGIFKMQTYEKGWVIYLEQAVTIKGTKSGIILVLDPSLSFEDLCLSIKDKFKEASSFLGRNNMGLHIRGRQLSDVETDRVVEIIQANSDLTITCIIDDESVF